MHRWYLIQQLNHDDKSMPGSNSSVLIQGSQKSPLQSSNEATDGVEVLPTNLLDAKAGGLHSTGTLAIEGIF